MESCLRQIKSDSSISPSYFTYFSPKQAWNVPNGEKHIIWSNYCELAYQGSSKLSLAENLVDVVPVIADLILSFDEESDIDCPDEFILSVIRCFQQTMIEKLQISTHQNELMCVLLETQGTWMENGYHHVGFRLQFPFCRVEIPIQQRVLKPRVLQFLRQQNIIGRLPCQPRGDWDQIFDASTLIEPITLYRSTKSPIRPPYAFQSIYPVLSNDDIMNGKVEHRDDLSGVFMPTNHTHYQQQIIPESIFANNQPLEYWLPMFLSIHYFNNTTLPKQSMIPSSTRRTATTTTRSTLQYSKTNFIELADFFLSLLDRSRVENDHYWIDVGRSLYNVHGGGEDGLQKWIMFTERSDNHCADDCRARYFSEDFIKNNPLSIKTLAFYAREDSFDSYQDWHESWVFSALQESLTMTHTDLAQALYRTYWLEYICDSPGLNGWHVYRNHRWFKIDQGMEIRQIISRDFLHQYEEYQLRLSQEISTCDDDGLKEIKQSNLAKIGKLVVKLKTVMFKNNVFRESMEFFYDCNFKKYKDLNFLTLGVNNGVIEITTDKVTYDSIIFRPGKPEDYITQNTGVNYVSEYTWGHPDVKKVVKWLNQIFPDPELYHHFMKMSSSIIRGKNFNKQFWAYSGNGDNSKSMLGKLLELTFGLGSYVVKSQTSMLTGQKSNSGAASPELARAGCARVMVFQEPDRGETIQCGRLKELTGGDSFYARMLNENGGDITPLFKMILMCNDIPGIMSGGLALKTRFRVIPFVSTWVDNPPESEEDQMKERKFKKDPNFDSQIPGMAAAFLWMLVEYYPTFMAEGIANDPKIVQEYTDQYWNDNDVFAQYVADRIERAVLPNGERDMDSKVIMGEINRDFQSWFKESFPNTKVPDVKALKSELERILGKQHRKSWHGIRMIVPMATI